MYPPADAVESIDLADIGWVHTAVYDDDVAVALAARCRAEGIRWSVDLEPATLRLGLTTARRWLEGAETVFLNRHAAHLLGGEPVRTLHALGVREVVLTLGPDGARSHVPNGRVVDAKPSSGVRGVVDTTGAGDALAGWYAARRLAGDSRDRALAEAVCAATLSCSAVGAQAAYPTRSDVLQQLDPPSSDHPRFIRKATL
jgi:ribokinase